MTYLTALQVTILGVNLFIMPTPTMIHIHTENMKKKKEEEASGKKEGEPSEKSYLQAFGEAKFSDFFKLSNLRENLTTQPFTCGSMIVLSCFFAGVSAVFIRRNVYSITLLPTNRVRFGFYTVLALGEPKYLEVPIRYVQCLQNRTSKTNYSWFRIKGHRFHYWVNKSKGQFSHPRLYDQYICNERFEDLKATVKKKRLNSC